ncbi:hypothetical protein [Parvularcula marina]|uniref:Uncharacterized protein n=1 Tax=Parvularcula marina TaxID=2292771 RepID=A0A371RIR3_9PROT|nr:hypothetical protein [Parvularcula marina]RFB05333.1 hypothetical protein DX908_08730 [Parvularcula marina]
MRRPLGDTIVYPVFLGGGLILWLLGLLAVRQVGGAVERFGGMAGLILASLLAAFLVAYLIRMVSKPGRLVEGMVVVTLSGLLADAVLLLSYPFAYGADERIIRFVMAWRVASAAFLLLAGVLLEQRPIAGKAKRRRSSSAKS